MKMSNNLLEMGSISVNYAFKEIREAELDADERHRSLPALSRSKASAAMAAVKAKNGGGEIGVGGKIGASEEGEFSILFFKHFR